MNGVVAEIDLSAAGTAGDPFRWVAVVPVVTSGTLPLVATAMDARGAKAEASRTIMVAAASNRPLLLPSASNGPAPLTVAFHVRADAPETVSQYELDLDGDGVYEITSPSIPEDAVFLYTVPGIHFATLRTTGIAGTTISSAPIVVQRFATVNAVIQQHWTRFADVLATSDVDAALAHLADDQTRRKYERPLRLIQPSLPEFAAGIRTIHPVWITGRAAHYVMTRAQDGQTHGFHVYFVRDASGVWKVAQF